VGRLRIGEEPPIVAGQLLAVAREYRRRDLPLSVIVCDFFHWPHMGDWRFNRADWPDPAAMVTELADLGVKLAVSIWPTVAPDSDNYDAMRGAGHLVGLSVGLSVGRCLSVSGFE